MPKNMYSNCSTPLNSHLKAYTAVRAIGAAVLAASTHQVGIVMHGRCVHKQPPPDVDYCLSASACFAFDFGIFS